MGISKHTLIGLVIAGSAIVVAMPFAIRFAQIQQHKTQLQAIFSFTYQYHADHGVWPEDFSFLAANPAFDREFIQANWGAQFTTLDQVLALNPANPAALVVDQQWQMVLDRNGFIYERSSAK